jgi:hypothetical protein
VFVLLGPNIKESAMWSNWNPDDLVYLCFTVFSGRFSAIGSRHIWKCARCSKQ